MSPYADTSFLVSLYLSDGNSAQAVAAVHSLDSALPVSEFHWLEFQNALTLAVFQKRITEDQSSQASQDAQPDLAKSETPQIGARSLDLLHVASPLLLGASDFLTFDIRQRSLATRARLNATLD